MLDDASVTLLSDWLGESVFNGCLASVPFSNRRGVTGRSPIDGLSFALNVIMEVGSNGATISRVKKKKKRILTRRPHRCPDIHVRRQQGSYIYTGNSSKISDYSTRSALLHFVICQESDLVALAETGPPLPVCVPKQSLLSRIRSHPQHYVSA